MANLRQYFWLFVVLGMVFITTILGIIFFFINKCISKRAKQYKTNSQQNANNEFYTQSSLYHPKHLEEDLPPLPPRNINLPSCPSTTSYDDIATLPDYVKVDEKAASPPPYKSTPTPMQKACPDRDSISTEAYDDVVPPGYESEDYDDVA
ncbi:hypothetical protein MATL_G00041250 [Megalops atlanticus]|uniref:SLP adapter and CSK-interacting membrane protein n=1 Tax=Megalops atlanticus TaxID=7932 RepID=A0A9D3TE84_MEGAT|nr:hypothetical protein MATL_G00041250 [Megalops atlanticus]